MTTTVAVKIRLKRMGKIRAPFYRVVVMDSRTKRDGRAIEEIGKYHPTEEPSVIQIDSERAQYWLGNGAQPTEAVAALLKITGDWQKYKGEPGTEGTLRVKAPKTSKKELYEAAVAAAGKSSGDDGSTATTPRKRAAKKAEPAAETPASDVTPAMGRISIVMSVAPAIGPAVSGLILQFLPWRGIFWVMLPISATMLLIGIARVPNVSESRKVPLDVPSVILSAVGFSGVVFGLSNLGLAAEGRAMMPSWIPLVVGGISLALFIWRQLRLQREDRALLDLRTFRSRTFALSIGFLVILMAVLFGVVILFPIYLEQGLGVEALIIGLTLLPGGLVMGLLGPLVGRLYDRFGPAPLVVPGSIVMSAAIWAMTLFDAETPIWFVLVTHVVLSIGLGFLFTPVFTAATGALPRHLYSHGSATIGTVQQVAGAAGTAAFIALLAVGTANAGAATPESATSAELIAGVHLAFVGGAILSLFGVVASFFIRRPVAPEITDEELESVPMH